MTATSTSTTPTIPATFGLNRRVKAWLKIRQGRPREWGFHPSEMKDFCPVYHHFKEEARADVASGDPAKVQAAFSFLRATVNTVRHTPDLQMEFRVGDHVHADVQFYLGVLGFLWGQWRCPTCFLVTPEGPMPRMEVQDVEDRPLTDAAPCVRCRGANLAHDVSWQYIEPHIVSQEYEIEGHTDGDLRIPQGGSVARLVLEIKSINEAGFKERYGVIPKPEHVQQASIYAWLMGVSHIVFIYVNKNQVHEWREFVVPRDEAAIALTQSKIRAVQNARLPGGALGAAPVHARACSDIREERARKCPAVEKCFGRRPPDNFMG